MSDHVQEYENFKKTIDDLKVKRLSDIREKERLEKEFEDLKAEIKEVYGVEIQDFEKAINDLNKELEKDLAELKEKIASCKEKMEIQ